MRTESKLVVRDLGHGGKPAFQAAGHADSCSPQISGMRARGGPKRSENGVLGEATRVSRIQQPESLPASRHTDHLNWLKINDAA